MLQATWPELEYQAWKPTYETLHRWLQIVGKLKLCCMPWTNHSWHSTFTITPRGFSTGSIPDGDRNFSIEFDFFYHQLLFIDSFGKRINMALKEESVASFFARFFEVLDELKITPSFDLAPNEVIDATPFHKDTKHSTYDPHQAHRCWQVMVRVNNVFQKYRSNYIGKSSPVHLFWGGFDLAISRFSGRQAPEHPGGIPHVSDEVTREAYSHEVMSCGFWPGNEMYPDAAFYAYAYPEPVGFSQSLIMPESAFYHSEMREFLLPYESVRNVQNPETVILSFMESAYRAAANLADWDREALEISPHLIYLKKTWEAARLH